MQCKLLALAVLLVSIVLSWVDAKETTVSVLNASSLPVIRNSTRIGVLLSANEVYFPPLLNERFVKAAVGLAVETVKRRQMLDGFDVAVQYGVTDHCSETLASLEAIDMFINVQAYVFIGPVCNYAIGPVSRIAAYWNLPVISPGALVNYFDQKNTHDYQTLTRMQGSFTQVGRFVFAAFSTWGFHRRAYVNYAFLALANPIGVQGKSDHEFVCWAARDDIYMTNSTLHQATKVLKVTPGDSKVRIGDLLKQISKTARCTLLLFLLLSVCN